MSFSMKNKRISALVAGVGAAAILAGCTVGPDYQRPSAPTTPQFKEAPGWRPSTPADTIDRGAWWSMYDDKTLDSLEQRVATSNQTVKQFEAAYRQAHEIVNEARSAYYPTIGASLSTARGTGGSTSGAGAFTGTGATLGSPTSTASGGTGATSTGSLEASWVPDLWGRVRRTVESNKALAQASAAEIANVKLVAQAALAEDYFELRVLDEETELYRNTVADYQQYLQLTELQFQAGTQSEATVVAAKTQLLTAQSAMIALGTTRAQMEHAIAVLTGVPPAELTIEPAKLSHRVPVVPAGVPSALLERRPDIAAAERTMASANAQIGVAISAFYPNLTISAGTVASLASGGMGLWSVGAAISQTIFDGGLRKAQVRAARATYDQDVAAYRQTVLTAFQGVEDELAALRIFQQQEEVALQAEAEARKAVELDLAQYKAGTVDYTTVLFAQAAELATSQQVLLILQERLLASALLVEDLGGGWDASELPKS